MKLLRLSARAAAAIRAESSAAYPREACGLLVGTWSETVLDVCEAASCRNIAEEPRRFELHPEDFLATELGAAARHLRVLGAWHSHPNEPAAPSESDRRGADPGWIHVIAATNGSSVPSIRAWDLAGTDPVEVRLAEESRDPVP